MSKDPVWKPHLRESYPHMAFNHIRAVVFDMGGTLEDLYYDESIRQEATRDLREFLAAKGLDPGLDLPDLRDVVHAGMKAYQTWRERSEIELPPERVWTEYVFPDHGLPYDLLADCAEDLAFFYETRYYVRSLRPEAPALLALLCERGFRLAIISNITSRQTVQHCLRQYGIEHYFAPVITSAGYGMRKPNERIFLEAARQMNLPPVACAYVGDTVSRDVIGARRASYGLAIQIKSFLTDRSDQGVEPAPPDAVIHDLMQVADLVDLHVETDHDH